MLGLVASRGDRSTPSAAITAKPPQPVNGVRAGLGAIVIVFVWRSAIWRADSSQAPLGGRPMPTHSLDQHMHDHVFLGESHARNERRTWFVVALTLVMMVGEIVAGSFFGSMALLADGWHMGTHAAALGIAGAAYLFARRQAG